jgi:hypothetical protein
MPVLLFRPASNTVYKPGGSVAAMPASRLLLGASPAAAISAAWAALSCQSLFERIWGKQFSTADYADGADKECNLEIRNKPELSKEENDPNGSRFLIRAIRVNRG